MTTVKQLLSILEAVCDDLGPDIPVRIYAEYDGGYGLTGGDITSVDVGDREVALNYDEEASR